MTYREKCYRCFRPQSSCMCRYTKKLDTNSLFVILMHPKEFQKTKNNTGILTHLNLKNSFIFKGIDFTHNKKINEIINNPNNLSYLLYPDNNVINLSKEILPKDGKQKVFFLIDSTWPCSKSILNQSKNLQNLPRISFDTTNHSRYIFKTQPKEYCLSTIETTQVILKLLNRQKIETLSQNQLEYFIEPFSQMVEYQVKKAQSETNIRYKPNMSSNCNHNFL